jgi:hypothetical protein
MMAGTKTVNQAAEQEFCEAARQGRLREYLEAGESAANAVLYGIVSEVVYERLTRGLERGRGHRECATSMWRLEPDCHDQYQDDVAAVRADLLRHADLPIANVRGWLVPRLKPVVVDDHRRRRGAIGAHQRPRLPLPLWLNAELGGDPWLAELAVEIMRWVGVRTAAGDGIWPLSAWSDRRSLATGQAGSTVFQVARDVERVLDAMRCRRPWYDQYIEGPLGHKQTPVAFGASVHGQDDGPAPSDLWLVSLEEAADARLLAVAGDALDGIRARIRHGWDPRAAAVEVVGLLFGRDADTGEQAGDLMADPSRVDRVVAAVLEILGEG